MFCAAERASVNMKLASLFLLCISLHRSFDAPAAEFHHLLQLPYGPPALYRRRSQLEALFEGCRLLGQDQARRAVDEGHEIAAVPLLGVPAHGDLVDSLVPVDDHRLLEAEPP